MKQIENFENVQASSGDYNRPTPGAYMIQIERVEDVPLNPSTGKGDYLKIEYDFIGGEFAGYYQKLFDKAGYWGGKFVRSYKEKAQGMFKRFIDCVSASTNGFVWDWNEQKLCGCILGVVLSEEEYIGNDGSIKTRLYVSDTITIDDFNNGNYKIRTKKTVERPNEPQPITVADDDLPF